MSTVAVLFARADSVYKTLPECDVYDMERLLARVITGRASPRDLSYIGRTLIGLPKLKAKLAARTSNC